MHAWLKFQGCGSKTKAATPFRISKLKWAWQAQFLTVNTDNVGPQLRLGYLSIYVVSIFRGCPFWNITYFSLFFKKTAQNLGNSSVSLIICMVCHPKTNHKMTNTLKSKKFFWKSDHLHGPDWYWDEG